MSYVEEVKRQIQQRNFNKLLLLWEEYCANDVVDVEEFTELLKLLKNSDQAMAIGKYAEKALPLWRLISDQNDSYTILKLIIDLQNLHTPLLAELAQNALQARYGNDPLFGERIRLIGMRNCQNFQGALSNYELLAHMESGNFVFHTGGWDVGQIVEVSPVREQLAVEFEFVAGRKHFNFANAFKTLVPLTKEHFLSRRFRDPDLLEKEARENPVAVIRTLLKDLGPKTAPEIKEELCELVIPESDWAKWWQSTRSKLKKEPLIETPVSLKAPFKLRKEEISSMELIHAALNTEKGDQQLIQQCYSLARDKPALLKEEGVKSQMREALLEVLRHPSLAPALEMEISLFFENAFGEELEGRSVAELIQKYGSDDEAINAIEILAYRKRILMAIREQREDWVVRFLSLLRSTQNALMRDYILKELQDGEAKEQLSDAINELLQNPTADPDTFFWYFQKLIGKQREEELPFSDKESLEAFFESFLILYNYLEQKPNYRDLLKKMYSTISNNRFAVVRKLLEGCGLDFAKEYLLLISKCQSLSDHDTKILRSLIEVVHPSLAARKKHRTHTLTDGHIIWTTHEGLVKAQTQLQLLGKEIVENAREIEIARSHGDLRENSEYKFALEKRAELQRKLKHSTDQLNRARILTKEDFPHNEAGVGSIVVLEHKNETHRYTILGPWDADTSTGILSFQSQLAQAMMGLKKGAVFQFREEDYTIQELSTIFD